MIINLTPLGIPFYKLSNIEYSLDNGTTWNSLSNTNVTDNDNYETYYVNNKGWMLVIKKTLHLRFNKTLDKDNTTAFLVGGGGGGGCGDHTPNVNPIEGGGGGGAGGECNKNTTISFNGVYYITIGDGGNGVPWSDYSQPGENGGDTKIMQNNTELIKAEGGQGGGNPIFNWRWNPSTQRDEVQVSSAQGGVGSSGGGSGGNGGIGESNATSGSAGTLLNIDFLTNNNIGNKWNNKTYGSGGGGGSGGTWGYIHPYYGSNNNITGYAGELTQDQGNPGQGGTYSGGKGGGKSTLKQAKQYYDNHDNYFWVIGVKKSEDTIYPINGSNNFGGGGGGGGSYAQYGGSCTYHPNFDSFQSGSYWNPPSDNPDGAWMNVEGADGGSGVCIIYYEK